MNKRTHGRKKHVPEGSGTHASHGPYWTRAHRDWRVQVGAVLMAIALGIYVLSGDLGWLYRGPRQQPSAVRSSHG